MMPSIHQLADVKSDPIGEGIQVWKFAAIKKDEQVGHNCNICAYPLIKGNVVPGDNVTVKPGVYLWDDIPIADDVFIGPQITFTNDAMPHPNIYPSSSTVSPWHVTLVSSVPMPPCGQKLVLAEYAMVNASVVATKDVLPYAVAAGSPVKIIRVIDRND
ncbi:N-acetyltransferase [Pseudomonas asiatica]|uniref:N-acetyltransferase n=1 Tax=Pseudomonas asiatica TaxID=2219225 RepID=UPI001BAF820D|nr:N-acetyltransferase [Pseudomonas asiatica]